MVSPALVLLENAANNGLVSEHESQNIYTLSLKSLSGHSSVCYKTSLNTGSVGWAGAAPPTYKLGKFLSWPLALSMSTYSNFQINGASGETFKVFVTIFTTIKVAISQHT